MTLAQKVSLKETHVVEIASNVSESQLEGIALALAKAAVEGRALIVSCKGGATDSELTDRHMIMLEVIRRQKRVTGQYQQHTPKQPMTGVVYLVPDAPAVGRSYLFITSGSNSHMDYAVPVQQLIEKGYAAINALRTFQT